MARNVSLTLAFDWTRGPLGGLVNAVVTSTGRRFTAWDAILGIQYH